MCTQPPLLRDRNKVYTLKRHNATDILDSHKNKKIRKITNNLEQAYMNKSSVSPKKGNIMTCI